MSQAQFGADHRCPFPEDTEGGGTEVIDDGHVAHIDDDVVELP